jgi:glycosyltransferase involved in cell wall biosynthesis
LIAPSLTGLGGGIEVYLRQLLEALARARPGARLVALLGREPRLARPELLSPELRACLEVEGAHDTAPHLRLPELALRVAAAARHRPRLVLCGHVNYAAMALALARSTGARWIALAYGLEAWRVRSRPAAAAMRRADRVVCISAFTAAEVMRELDLPPERVAVLHNGVDVARFTPGAPSPTVERRLAHLPRPRLLSVCRLDAGEGYKGVDQVIEAVARLRASRSVSYVVAGSGSDLPRLRALASARAPGVEFLGRVADGELADLYRACDLFVMPSRNEGFGYVFIEAMACGLPVVAGSVDGSVDALAGGKLGLLVDPLDVPALAGAIAAQLDGATPPALRDPARLRAEVVERFGLPAFQRRLQAILSDEP